MPTKPGDWDNVDESLVQLAAVLELTISSLNNSFTFEDGSELFPTAAHRSYGTQRLTNRQRNSNWLAKLRPDWNPYLSLRLTRRPYASVAVPLTDIIQRNISRLHANAMSGKSSRSKGKSSSSKKARSHRRSARSHSPKPSSSRDLSSDEESVGSGLATAFQRGCSTTANTPATLGFAYHQVTYLKPGFVMDGKDIVIPVRAKDKRHDDQSKRTDVVPSAWCILRAPGSTTQHQNITAELVPNVAYWDDTPTSAVNLAYYSKLPYLKRNGDQLIKTVHLKAGYVDKNGGVLTAEDESPFVDGFNATFIEVESDSEDEGEDDKKHHLYVLPPVHTVFRDALPGADWSNIYWSSLVKSETKPNALHVTPDTYGETIEWKDTKGDLVKEKHDDNVVHLILAVDKTEVATARKKKKATTETDYAEWKEKNNMMRGA